jgi:hypothetical protein
VSLGATRLVHLYGPEDPQLWRLVAVVADFADWQGRNAKVGQRLLADRTHHSTYGVRLLVIEAVHHGWLAVDRAGDKGFRAVYHLGPQLTNRAASARILEEVREFERQTRALSARGSAPLPAKTQECARTDVLLRNTDMDSRARRTRRAAGESGMKSKAALPSGSRDRSGPTDGSVYDAFPNWTAERLAAGSEIPVETKPVGNTGGEPIKVDPCAGLPATVAAALVSTRSLRSDLP